MARAEGKMSLELLNALEIGQVLEVGNAIPALGTEPFCFELVGKNEEKRLYTFEVSAYEIHMLSAFAKVDQHGKILWEIEK